MASQKFKRIFSLKTKKNMAASQLPLTRSSLKNVKKSLKKKQFPFHLLINFGIGTPIQFKVQ